MKWLLLTLCVIAPVLAQSCGVNEWRENEWWKTPRDTPNELPPAHGPPKNPVSNGASIPAATVDQGRGWAEWPGADVEAAPSLTMDPPKAKSTYTPTTHSADSRVPGPSDNPSSSTHYTDTWDFSSSTNKRTVKTTPAVPPVSSTTRGYLSGSVAWSHSTTGRGQLTRTTSLTSLPTTAKTTSPRPDSASYTSTVTNPTVTFSSLTPTSCYRLPLNTQSATKISINVKASSSLVNGPVDFYIDGSNNPTNIIGTTIDGNYVTFDLSDPSNLAITMASGETIQVNSEGVFYYAADCSVELAVYIEGFDDQAARANTTTLIARDGFSPRYARGVLLKRDETSFPVIIYVVDKCGNPDNTGSPILSLGLSTCSLSGTKSGEYIFSCQYPGEQSPEAICERNLGASVAQWITGPIGSLSNLSSAANLLSLILKNRQIRQDLELLVKSLAAGVIADILAALSIVISAISTLDPDLAAQVCTQLHHDEPMALEAYVSDAGLVTLTTLTAAPTGPLDPTITTTITATAVAAGSTCSQSTTTSLTATSTTSAPPQYTCSGSACGTYQICAAGGQCFCGMDTSGESRCFQNNLCQPERDADECTSNSDCGTDDSIIYTNACIVDSCCGFKYCEAICTIRDQYWTPLAPDANLGNTTGLLFAGIQDPNPSEYQG